MSKIKNINLEIDLDDGGSRTYTGRFLGFVKPDEFNALVQEEEAARKIETRPSVDFIKVFSAFETGKKEFLSWRIVLATKTINGEPAGEKKLFVSEPLDILASLSTEKREARLVTINDTDIYISEGDK